MSAKFERLAAQGQDLFIQGHHARAKEFLEAAYKMNPRDREVLVCLAGCSLAQRNEKAALSYLTEALGLNPNDDEIREPLVNLQFRMRLFDDTISTARSILADDPDNLEASWLLGLALHGTGQFEEAKRIFLNVVSRSPTSLEGMFGLAIIENYNGNPQEFADRFNNMIVEAMRQDRLADVLAWLDAQKPGLAEAILKRLDEGLNGKAP
jgi:tetratricopeptide (TPR) repeat protein